MKYIVTGATGFIGFALCSELLKRGEEVIAVVRPHSSRREKLSTLSGKLTIYELELKDIEKLDCEYRVKADVFFHLAWNGSAGSEREVFEIQYKNIDYTIQAIKTAQKCGCRRIIGAGSQAEYGVYKEKAVEDRVPANPFMMYGAAKLATYNMGSLYAKQIGMEFIWPRIYSVYGVGENPGTLVNYCLDCLKKGEPPQVSNCENTWNFIYISDCVEMLILLSKSEDAKSGVYHIASGDTGKLKDFVNEMCEIKGTGIKPVFGAKQSDPDRTFFLNPDISKIKAIGGECRVSFSEGIKKKIENERPI